MRPPVDDAAVVTGPCQPGLGIADGSQLGDQDEKRVLEDVFGVLRGNPVAAENALQLRLRPREDLFEGRLPQVGLYRRIHSSLFRRYSISLPRFCPASRLDPGRGTLAAHPSLV